jgi:hypothetical protein
MATGMLCWSNHAIKAALSGGAWQTPLANLQARFLSRVARTAGLDLAATRFDVDLGRERTIKLVAVPGHNLSPSARVRVCCYADAAHAVCKLDSGWLDAWPPVYSTMELEWEDDNWWSGRVLPEDVDAMPHNFIYLPPRQVYCRYLSVEIDDRSNPDGYVDLSRLFITSGWQPVFNFSFDGLTLGYESNTYVDSSLSGAKHFEERPAARIQAFRLDNMTRVEGVNKALAMTRALDISGEVFFISDPGNQMLMQQTSFLGRLRELSPLEYVTVGIHGMAYVIEEVVA